MKYKTVLKKISKIEGESNMRCEQERGAVAVQQIKGPPKKSISQRELELWSEGQNMISYSVKKT